MNYRKKMGTFKVGLFINYVYRGCSVCDKGRSYFRLEIIKK